MKAKAYADAYKARIAEDPDIPKAEALARVVLQPITVEFADLTVSRHVNTPSGILACFREIEQRYAAFCRLASDDTTLFRPEGWRCFLQEVRPELWAAIRDVMTVEKVRTP